MLLPVVWILYALLATFFDTSWRMAMDSRMIGTAVNGVQSQISDFGQSIIRTTGIHDPHKAQHAVCEHPSSNTLCEMAQWPEYVAAQAEANTNLNRVATHMVSLLTAICFGPQIPALMIILPISSWMKLCTMQLLEYSNDGVRIGQTVAANILFGVPIKHFGIVAQLGLWGATTLVCIDIEFDLEIVLFYNLFAACNMAIFLYRNPQSMSDLTRGCQKRRSAATMPQMKPKPWPWQQLPIAMEYQVGTELNEFDSPTKLALVEIGLKCSEKSELQDIWPAKDFPGTAIGSDEDSTATEHATMDLVDSALKKELEDLWGHVENLPASRCGCMTAHTVVAQLCGSPAQRVKGNNSREKEQGEEELPYDREEELECVSVVFGLQRHGTADNKTETELVQAQHGVRVTGLQDPSATLKGSLVTRLPPPRHLTAPRDTQKAPEA